jgi:hypothetical protein
MTELKLKLVAKEHQGVKHEKILFTLFTFKNEYRMLFVRVDLSLKEHRLFKSFEKLQEYVMRDYKVKLILEEKKK